jgi:hypothetical protein
MPTSSPCRFPGAYPWRKARDALIELRAALPAATGLWAGGAGLAGRGRGVEGVHIIGALRDLAPALAEWHAAHPQRGRH